MKRHNYCVFSSFDYYIFGELKRQDDMKDDTIYMISGATFWNTNKWSDDLILSLKSNLALGISYKHTSYLSQTNLFLIVGQGHTCHIFWLDDIYVFSKVSKASL